jgi:hypothetical protein
MGKIFGPKGEEVVDEDEENYILIINVKMYTFHQILLVW